MTNFVYMVQNLEYNDWYYLRFFFNYTIRVLALFTNFTLTIVCDIYNENYSQVESCRIIFPHIYQISAFYNFYLSIIKDINDQSYALANMKVKLWTKTFKKDKGSNLKIKWNIDIAWCSCLLYELRLSKTKENMVYILF